MSKEPDALEANESHQDPERPAPSPKDPDPGPPASSSAAEEAQRRFRLTAGLGGVALVGLVWGAAILFDPKEPSALQPTAQQEDLLRPAFKAKIEPAQPVQPAPALPRDLVRRAPVPQDEAPEPGDGGQLLGQALAALPPANLRERRALEAIASDPRVKLDPEAQRYLRAAWPAVQLLARAARARDFTRPELKALTRPRLLALAALARGRFDLNGGATAKGARWACDVVRLGHRLADGAPLLERGLGLGLARLGERWLTHALEELPWSEAELDWLRARLTALTTQRPRFEPPQGRGGVADLNTSALAAQSKAAQAEQEVLAGLLARAKKTTSAEGGAK